MAPPRFVASGSGRDLFQDETRSPPKQSTRLSPERAIHGRASAFSASVHPPPIKYQPTGNRDWHCRTDGTPPPRNTRSPSPVAPKQKRNGAGSGKFSPLPTYVADGSGRDLFLRVGSGSKLPARPPSPHLRASPTCARPRSCPPPNYKPSGSGRDTFHDVRTAYKPPRWALREYHSTTPGFNYGSAKIVPSAQRRLFTPGQQREQRRLRKCQRAIMQRLSRPKSAISRRVAPA